MMAVALCAATVVQAQTLNIGNYDELEPYSDPGGYDAGYDGSYWEIAPINYYLAHSGAQILYLKEEIAPLAGKEITAFSFPYFTIGAYIDATRDVKLYLTETSATQFYRNNDNHIYRFFDLSRAKPVYEGTISPEVYLYEYVVAEPITITLDQPYYYSGESTLVLTFIAENGEQCTNGGFYVNFFPADNTAKHALPFASDFDTFQSVLFGDRWCEGAHISPIYAPVQQIAYQDGTEPAPQWCSYVPDEDVDLDIGGFAAYKLTDYSPTNVKLERVTSAPKGTPLLLRSVVYPSIIATTSPAHVTNNMFMISDGTVMGGNHIFVLGEKDGMAGLTRLPEGQVVPEGEVYFKGAVDTNDFLPLEYALGIDNVMPVDRTAESGWYTMQGVRVQQPTTPGIYVSNGRKVLIQQKNK